MKFEKIRQKRFRNEELQDEMIQATYDLERKANDLQQLFYHERQLNEEIMEDYYRTASGYEYEQIIDEERYQERKLMETFESLDATFQKARKELEEENEMLYQAELDYWKEKEEENGKS